VLDKDALIVLKAKAYLNNLSRKLSGQHVHQDDIDKHKKDIYRLSYLFVGNERYAVADEIKEDLRLFVDSMSDHPINTKAIARYMNLPELSQAEFVDLLTTIFGL
jgi:hypothetical protein